LAKLVLLIGARLRLPDWLVFGLVAIVALSAGIVFHLVIEKPAIRLAARLAPVRNRAARPPPLHPQP